MGGGRKKYYKRKLYIPKNRFVGASGKKEEEESKVDPHEWFKKFKKDIGKEEKESQ